MDTPSSPKSGSYLGIVVGILAVIAVILSAVALQKATAAGKKGNDELAALSTRLDTIEASIKGIRDEVGRQVSSQRATYDRYFDQINTEFANLRTQINKVSLDTKDLVDKMSSAPVRSTASAGGSGGPAAAPGTIAEDGTYVIKSGDTLSKVAAAHGISLADLQAANPGVDPRRLHVGQKIVLPQR